MAHQVSLQVDSTRCDTIGAVINSILSVLGRAAIRLSMWWLLAATYVSGATIYTNLGPNDSWNGFAAYNGAGFNATTFTATATAHLASILIPVENNSEVSLSGTVGLYTNASGQPGTLLESWTISFPAPGNYIAPLTSIVSVTNPLLQVGTQYWLAANIPDGAIIWEFNNQGIDGGIWYGTTPNGLYNTTTSDPAPAIQLNGVTSARTFVSIRGNDANEATNCSAASNCRTLVAALAVTQPGGEIVIVDSGGYGQATITQPVIVTAIDTDASILVTTSGASGLTIYTTGNVTLNGLSLHGEAIGEDGILVEQVGFLRLYNTLIENFTVDGVNFATPGTLSVYGSKFNDNGHDGILISNASANAYVSDSVFDDNLNAGVEVASGQVSVTDSSAEYNSDGFSAHGGTLVVSNDAVVSNLTGLRSDGGILQFVRCLIADNSTAYNVSGGTIMGSNPGSSLIAPGQGSVGSLATPIPLQ